LNVTVFKNKCKFFIEHNHNATYHLHFIDAKQLQVIITSSSTFTDYFVVLANYLYTIIQQIIKIIMKKTIIYSFMALVAFTNVALASKINEVINAITYSATPLCQAVCKGDMDVVKKFIEYGADVNETSNGITPLMFAARYNNVEMIQFLIDKGANITAKDTKGYTALKYAELSGAKEATAYLKEIKK